jgi:PIN like domain
MREMATNYSRPTREQFKQMWQDCVFIFDTNVLLHIYRYTNETRNSLLSAIESLKENGKIWLPHQVMLEYLENREEVITTQYSVDTDIEKILEQALNTIEGKYKRGHLFANAEFITWQVRRAMKNIRASIVQAQSQYPNLLETDVFLDRWTNIFDGRVGSPYPPEKLEEIFKEFEQRFKSQTPPGYKDSKTKKEGFKKYGDGIIWFQMIDYAKSLKKPVIFIVDDRKEDWWRVEKGKTLGPRPELITEFSLKAKVSFYMYNASQFLKYAREFLGLEIEQKVIDEANDISQQIGITYSVNGITSLLEPAQLLLKDIYPEHELIISEIFLVEKPAGVNYAFEGKDELCIAVRYLETFFPLDELIILESMFKGMFSDTSEQYLMILVYQDELIANLTKASYASLSSQPSIPIDSRFIIGYVNSGKKFSVILTVP